MCIVKKLMNYFPTKNFLKRINMSLAGRANDQLFLWNARPLARSFSK